MKNLYRLFATAFGLGLLAGPAAHAQLGIGYPGTTAPRTMLDWGGGEGMNMLGKEQQGKRKLRLGLPPTIVTIVVVIA